MGAGIFLFLRKRCLKTEKNRNVKNIPVFYQKLFG